MDGHLPNDLKLHLTFFPQASSLHWWYTKHSLCWWYTKHSLPPGKNQSACCTISSVIKLSIPVFIILGLQGKKRNIFVYFESLLYEYLSSKVSEFTNAKFFISLQIMSLKECYDDQISNITTQETKLHKLWYCFLIDSLN